MSAGPRTEPFPCRRSVPRSVYPLPWPRSPAFFEKRMRQHSGGSASKRSISANRLRTRLTASIRWRGERPCTNAARHASASPPGAPPNTSRSRLTCSVCELYQRLQPGRAAAGFQLAYKHRGYADLLRQLFLREPPRPGVQAGCARRSPDCPSRTVPLSCFDISLQLMLIFCNKLTANLLLL